jgi:hypothetical protein
VKEKPDDYHYVWIHPKAGQAADFAKARLAIRRKDHLLGQVGFIMPNGNEMTWSFTEWQVNVKIGEQYFRPDLPAGWKLERVAPLPAVPNK